MILNGTDDPLIPYNGGKAGLMPEKTRNRLETQGHSLQTLSTAETIRLYREINQCANEPVVRKIKDRANDGCTSEEIIYTGRNGLEIVLVKTTGGGHGIPGQAQYLGRRIIGTVTQDFNAIDIIWPFFERAVKARNRSN